MRSLLCLTLCSFGAFSNTLVAVDFAVKKGNCLVTDVEDGVIYADPNNSAPAKFTIQGDNAHIVIEHIDIQPVTGLDKSDLTMTFNLGYAKTIFEMEDVGVKNSILKSGKENNLLTYSSKEPMSGTIDIYFDVVCD